MSHLKKWKKEVKENLRPILFSIVFFIIAGILNYFSGNFADRAGGISVPDIILDNLPVINIPNFYVFGIFSVIGLLLLYPFFFCPKYFPIAMGNFALMVLIRNFFIILTHLGSPTGAIPIQFPWPVSAWAFDNDLFFSGHFAVPFLGFLIFKKSKIKWVFLLLTIIMGITVLITHRHYSLDVFASIFITYGSYKLANWLFNKIGFKIIR